MTLASFLSSAENMKKKRDYKKIFVFWATVFLLGGLAGILGTQLLLPWLAGHWPFNKIGWIERAKEGTTIINRTERIIISEDLAYLDAINHLSNSVVGVRAEKHYRLINKRQVPLSKPEILAEGSGFILTSDGLIVTADILVPQVATRVIVIRENKEIEAQIIKRDELNGLALLKTNEANLPVVTFGDANNLKLGETVFLVGMNNSTSTPVQFINIGFAKTLLPEISVNFSENQLTNGSPLANIKGEVLGLNLVDKDGAIHVVLTNKIKELLKL